MAVKAWARALVRREGMQPGLGEVRERQTCRLSVLASEWTLKSSTWTLLYQHRTSKVCHSLKYFESKQLVQPLVPAWHPVLTFPTLLCFICLRHQSLFNRCCWQILCVFMVSVQCPCGPELLEGTFLTMAGFPFNSWVSISRGDLSGGQRGCMDNDGVSQLRTSWTPDLNGPYREILSVNTLQNTSWCNPACLEFF